MRNSSAPSRYFIPVFLCLAAAARAASFEDSLRQGETYRERGQIHLALDTLEPLQGLAATPEQAARLAGALGHAHYLVHQPDHHPAARAWLEKAALSDRLPMEARGRYANLLANLLLEESAEGKGQAAEWYARALRWAAGNPALALSVRLNQARLLPMARRAEALGALFGGIAALPDAPEQTRLFLALGQQARTLGSPALALSFSCLDRAVAGARRQGSERVLAESLGALGRLYEDQARTDEALRLTEGALKAAQGGQEHVLLGPLDAQLGRLLHRQGKQADALDAYRRAARHIAAVREDLPIRYDAEGRSSFREQLAPVYLALADLLLRQAAQEPAQSQALLREARDAVEQSRQAELEDYLGDRCAVHGRQNRLPQALAPDTAALYPIVLPDRLELLLETREGLRRFTVPVAAAELRVATRALAAKLRSTRRLPYRDEAERLHAWLVAPLEQDLRALGVATLLMVPDDFLRLVPLAALHDGKQFLIERYALAVSPALTVLASHSAARSEPKLLLAGLSKPRGGYEALPGVAQEVRGLHAQFDSLLLLDEDFKVAPFSQRLAEGGYGVVHIASHGEFEGEAGKTYVMAYDGDIRLDALEAMLKSSRRGAVGLDLLTFSACQTAAGNDRAPLGFSGMAVRAHARSVVGTLWQVNDQAAQAIMAAFYRYWLVAGLRKAEALRRAQLEWLRGPAREHPFYWSPFILVGDWL
jgi:CHAT domain-containing protein